MIYLRSALFNILFFIWMFFISWSAFFMGIFTDYRGVCHVGEICAVGVRFLLKYIVGVEIDYRGQENIPEDRKYIIGCKHQSAWETVSLHTFVKYPTVIMKKQLLKVPIFGQVVKMGKAICIDRSKGKEVIPQIIDGAKESFERDCPVLIFPEGTRSAPGKPGRYRYGIAAMYKELNVPILPIAHNAGYFWPRRGFLKKPGKLVMEILPPIEPGLEPEELLKRLENDIESACARIGPHEPEKESLKHA